jgi:dethiobiotin synthase
VSVVVVTGTGTGVGKTVTTAALAAVTAAAGRSVAVVKPCQTGTATGEPTDVEEVTRLSGCRRAVQLVGLPDPLAPDTAARLRGVQIPAVARLADDVAAYADGADLTYVEGAGGVLVRLDRDGGTLLTLATHLSRRGMAVEVVVVTTLALGTLNHTELTVAAIRQAGLPVGGLVLGSVPERLGLAEEHNLTELPRVTGLRVLGAIPSGAGGMTPERFRTDSARWFPALPF